MTTVFICINIVLTLCFTYLFQIYLGNVFIIVGYLLLIIVMNLVYWNYIRLQKRIYDRRLLAILEQGKIGASYQENQLSVLEHKLYTLSRETKNLAEKSIRDRENISSLVSDISHQIKTPLSSIIMYGDRLLGMEQEAWDVKSCAKIIRLQGEKLNFLFNALTKISHCESGLIKANMHLNNHKISELIAVAMSSLYLEAERKALNVITEGITEIQACFDFKWTVEAVSAVLDNSIKYTGTNGAVMIKVIRLEFFVCIEITDTGIGIPEEEIHKIFERFYRGKNASEDGVGIGLYLASQIINAEHGHIGVESTEGQGTTFRVYLPKSDETVSF